MRLEDNEARMTFNDLNKIWKHELAQAQEQVEAGLSLDQMVDVIRKANLRTELARLQGLEKWRDAWFLVKYAIMIRAIEHRSSGGGGIMVSVDFVGNSKNHLHREKVDVGFLVQPIPYFTRTSISNLERLMHRNQLLVLIGKPDEKRQERPERPKYSFNAAYRR